MEEESQSSEWSVELNVKLQENTEQNVLPLTKHEQTIQIFKGTETFE